jgi:hypothetical protein
MIEDYAPLQADIHSVKNKTSVRVAPWRLPDRWELGADTISKTALQDTLATSSLYSRMVVPEAEISLVTTHGAQANHTDISIESQEEQKCSGSRRVFIQFGDKQTGLRFDESL